MPSATAETKLLGAVRLCQAMARAAAAAQFCNVSLGCVSDSENFTLCDRACGVLANESQAQWRSDRTQGPLGAPAGSQRQGREGWGGDKGKEMKGGGGREEADSLKG